MKVCVKQSLLMLSLLVALPARAVVSPGQNMWGIVQQTADTVDEMSETVSIMDSKIDTLEGGCTTTPITEPTTITVSGSYCLANNIEGSIVIDADAVTLDLNGYTLSDLSQSLNIITIATGHKSINIKNGFITGGLSGINISEACRDFIISDIDFSDVSFLAVSMQATNTFSTTIKDFTIKSCAIRSSGVGYGLYQCINGEIVDCIVSETSFGGVSMDTCVNIVVSDCTIQNFGSSNAGILIGTGFDITLMTPTHVTR